VGLAGTAESQIKRWNVVMVQIESLRSDQLRQRKRSPVLPSSDPAEQRSERPPRTLWWRAAVIVLAGVVAFANSLSGPFIIDDQDSIVTNDRIRRLWPPGDVLFAERENPVAGRPVVNVSFALNYAVGGLEVRGYHVVNVAIHIVSALLLFGIVRRTLNVSDLLPRFGPRSADFAFACALIWLVHPLQTEAVDYLTERTELLMGLFYLLTLYASIRGHERAEPRTGPPGQPPRWGPGTAWQAVAVVSCVLGMGSKESMATAPVMILTVRPQLRFRVAEAGARCQMAFVWGARLELARTGGIDVVRSTILINRIRERRGAVGLPAQSDSAHHALFVSVNLAARAGD
jgi:hypothetical protein